MVFLGFYLNTKEWKIRCKFSRVYFVPRLAELGLGFTKHLGYVGRGGPYEKQATRKQKMMDHQVSKLSVPKNRNRRKIAAFSNRSIRKSVASIKFPPIILGPEMAAPILWAPGIFGLFLLENPHAHKIPPFRGGVLGFF